MFQSQQGPQVPSSQQNNNSSERQSTASQNEHEVIKYKSELEELKRKVIQTETLLNNEVFKNKLMEEENDKLRDLLHKRDREL